MTRDPRIPRKPGIRSRVLLVRVDARMLAALDRRVLALRADAALPSRVARADVVRALLYDALQGDAPAVSLDDTKPSGSS